MQSHILTSSHIFNTPTSSHTHSDTQVFIVTPGQSPPHMHTDMLTASKLTSTLTHQSHSLAHLYSHPQPLSSLLLKLARYLHNTFTLPHFFTVSPTNFTINYSFSPVTLTLTFVNTLMSSDTHTHVSSHTYSCDHPHILMITLIVMPTIAHAHVLIIKLFSSFCLGATLSGIQEFFLALSTGFTSNGPCATIWGVGDQTQISYVQGNCRYHHSGSQVQTFSHTPGIQKTLLHG